LDDLHYSSAAADRLEYIFRHYPDVFNCISILLREIASNPNVGKSVRVLDSLERRTILETRILSTMQQVDGLPPDYAVHFMEIPDRAFPPPNIAVVCYHPEPRIIIAAGYIPRREKTLTPAPFQAE
jgi:hypothetical protein